MSARCDPPVGAIPAPGLLIDVTRLVWRRMQGWSLTGVDRVSLAYVSRYGAQALALVRYRGRHLVLGEVDSKKLFAQLAEPAADFRILLRVWVTRAWWRRPRRWPGWLLFNTGHSGLEEAGYAARLARLQVRPVFFLHDLIPISHPEYCREGEAFRHAQRLQVILQQGAGVIANSQSTLDMMTSYARARHLPRPPATSALLAPPLLPVPFSRPLGPGYFVMVGTIESRKNHWMILQIWRRLVELWGESAPWLVIIGRRGWESENVVDLLERSPQLQGRVVEQGSCSDSQLVTWLAHAQALLFPSFAEGYGLPLVESLAAGTPVLASDLPVFREIAGLIPEYLDPLDGLGWQACIEAYSTPGSAPRVAQQQRMLGWQAPDWDTHFARVDAFLAGL
jgi:glycosyltransferase involved in cell wall biosynthesis